MALIKDEKVSGWTRAGQVKLLKGAQLFEYLNILEYFELIDSLSISRSVLIKDSSQLC